MGAYNDHNHTLLLVLEELILITLPGMEGLLCGTCNFNVTYSSKFGSTSSCQRQYVPFFLVGVCLFSQKNRESSNNNSFTGLLLKKNDSIFYSSLKMSLRKIAKRFSSFYYYVLYL